MLDAHICIDKMVDVCGTSKGKGFQGVMKRWNFGGGRATHGNSLAHRIPGSTGCRQDPGRVFKNKKMPGKTILNLKHMAWELLIFYLCITRSNGRRANHHSKLADFEG